MRQILVRVFLVKYIYLYMHQIFDVWNFIVTIIACVHCFYFCHQNKTFKQLQKNVFYSTKKASFVLKIFRFFYCPPFSFLCHCWFYRRSWFMINHKVCGIIMSLNWILKTDWLISDESKVLILKPCEMIEYCIEKISMDRFGCPNTNFGLLHWQGDSLAYSVGIPVLDFIWSKDHWEPWNEVWFQSLNQVYN